MNAELPASRSLFAKRVAALFSLLPLGFWSVRSRSLSFLTDVLSAIERLLVDPAVL